MFTATPISRPDLSVFETNPRRTGMIGSQVLPPLMVKDKTGPIRFVSAAPLMSRHNVDNAKGSNATRSTLGTTSTTYTCKKRRHEVQVFDDEISEYRDIDPATLAAQKADGVVAAEYEANIADLCTGAGSLWAIGGVTGANVATAWNNAAGLPASDVATALETLLPRNGVNTDRVTLILPADRYAKMAFVTDVRQRLQITTDPFRTKIPVLDLTGYFNVGRILVPGLTYNSADEGLAEVIARVWASNQAFLFVHADMANPRDMTVPQIGRTIVWEGPYENTPEQIVRSISEEPEPGSLPTQIVTYREKQSDSYVTDAQAWTDEKFFGTRFGYRLGNI